MGVGLTAMNLLAAVASSVLLGMISAFHLFSSLGQNHLFALATL